MRTATPAPSAAVPQGPFAVLVTNSERAGTSYQVVVLDAGAHVVARVTAALPLLQPNQSVDLPLTTASGTRVYYRNGDQEIDSLQVSGVTTVVRHIPEGASAEVAFAVSPDDQRIAIAVIKEASDSSKDASHGYVEDLSGPTNHVDLFSNTGADVFRWPVGWHGALLVDAVGQCGGGPYYYGPQSAVVGASPCSYHVIDATSGARQATVCESAHNAAPYPENYNPTGNPSSAGTACLESQSEPPPTYGVTETVIAVDWSGSERDYFTSTLTTCCANVPTSCFMAPAGIQMACLTQNSRSLELLRSNGKTQDLGRRYTPLGWIDSTRLVVEVDASTLGVLDTTSAVVTTLAQPNADKVAFAAALPGGL